LFLDLAFVAWSLAHVVVVVLWLGQRLPVMCPGDLLPVRVNNTVLFYIGDRFNLYRYECGGI
jgi:hypothetical protein